MNRFVDRDALMRHFGHGIGHLECGRVHEVEPEISRDEDREENEQETEYRDKEEGHELMDVDGNEQEEESEEPTDDSTNSGDDSDDSENSDDSGYASF